MAMDVASLASCKTYLRRTTERRTGRSRPRPVIRPVAGRSSDLELGNQLAEVQGGHGALDDANADRHESEDDR